MLGLDLIRKLKPARWMYNKLKPNDNKIHLGFIAQDLIEVLDQEKYALVIKDKDGYYMVNYHELIGPIVKAIQQLDEKVENHINKGKKIKGE